MTDVWTMNSREEEIEYCKAHGIDLPFDASHSYSRDRNLWHISHEGLELEDPANEPNYDDLLVLRLSHINRSKTYPYLVYFPLLSVFFVLCMNCVTFSF